MVIFLLLAKGLLLVLFKQPVNCHANIYIYFEAPRFILLVVVDKLKAQYLILVLCIVQVAGCHWFKMHVFFAGRHVLQLNTYFG